MIKLLTNQPNKIRCHNKASGISFQQFWAPMKRMGTATASPTQQPSNGSTTVLLVIGGLLLIGLVYSAVVRDTPVSCPNELVGAWITAANGYENGMLVFTKAGVSFSRLLGCASCGASMTEGPRTLYTIVYAEA